MKKYALHILTFLSIAFIITYFWVNHYVSFGVFIILVGFTTYIYVEDRNSKIVIQKRHLKTYRFNKSLINQYVMFIELSNINTYSQYYDITMGDDILKNVYRNLRKYFSKSQIYLYSTNQIVIVCDFVNKRVINKTLRYDEQYRNATKVFHYINSTKEELSNGYKYDINVKIGVAAQGEILVENTLHELIRLAEFAMIKSKEKSYDIIVATDELRIIKKDLDSFNQEIEKGFRLDEFTPYYLPIIDLKSMKVIGCEALVRWRKDQYRVIETSKFKDIAIEKNLFEKIDRRVIEKAFQSYQVWVENGVVEHGFQITVNLSHKSLVNLKPSELEELVLAYNIDKKNVEFDITDDSVISENGLDAITKIKDLGFRVSLDTFDNRCFTFQSLLAIDLDTIKIDKSILPNSEISNKERNFYTSIVAFSKAMNLNVLSKGIEHRHHLEIAQQLNVDYAQGYYFTPPLDDENIIVYLNKYKRGILTH